MIVGVFSGWVSRVERQGLAVVVCIIVWGSAMAVFGVSVALVPSSVRYRITRVDPRAC